MQTHTRISPNAFYEAVHEAWGYGFRGQGVVSELLNQRSLLSLAVMASLLKN